MVDKYNRKIEYLRVSLTDRCNFRCRYCMPEEGICKKMHNDMLSMEEFEMAIRAVSTLGIKKIRFTGGEPLVKEGVIDLIKKTKKIEGIEEICMTTNASLLKNYARDLKNAGLDRLNISLDTLDKNKFKYITRIGDYDATMEGIEEAEKVGFKKIKINAVLIGGFNDDEIIDLTDITLKKNIDVRFIELMPMTDSKDFDKNSYIPYTVALEKIKKKYPSIKEVKRNKVVAKYYHIDGALADVGFISPVSCHFCKECNRIRLTADGKIKPCLHSKDEISIKGLNELQMIEKFKEAILMKPEKHEELSYGNKSKANRNMNQIGG